MIMNPRFDEVLRSKYVSKRLRYFAVDEAHLVIEWMNFRQKFLSIWLLRNRFVGLVTWLGLTATVEPTREFPELAGSLGFNLNKTTVIRLPLDRRTIALAPRFQQHPQSDTEFLDLSWVVPKDATRVSDIPVTVIFVDELKQVDNLHTYLVQLLPNSIKGPARGKVVRQITGIMSMDNNSGVVEDVSVGGNTRIVICTDTGALGIDVTQVKRVVVVVEKAPSLRMICQKIGRIRTSGLGVILFPRWMNLARSGVREMAQRAEVDPVIIRLANATLDKCPRVINAEYWGDTPEPFDSTQHPCCNRHNPDIDRKHLEEVALRASAAKKKARAKRGAEQGSLQSDRTHAPPDEAVMQPIARQIIIEWRRLHLPEMIGYQTHMPFSVLLPDHLVTRLAKKLHICTTLERFQTVMASWTHLNEWGESLFNVVADIWEVLESEPIAEPVKQAQERRKSARQEVAAAGSVASEEGLGSHSHVATLRAQKTRSSISKKASSRANPTIIRNAQSQTRTKRR